MPSKTTTEESGPAKTVMDPITDIQQEGLSNMLGLSQAWMEMMSDMGAEVMNFVAERVKEDVKTQHQVLHCKDVKELQHIQYQFIQTAIDQYQAETGKLVEMGSGMMSSMKSSDAS